MSLSDFVRKFEFVEPDTKSLRSFVNACHLFNLAGGAKTDEEALLEEHPYTFVPGNVLPTLFGVMHMTKGLVTQLDHFAGPSFEEETEKPFNSESIASTNLCCASFVRHSLSCCQRIPSVIQSRLQSIYLYVFGPHFSNFLVNICI